MCWIGFQTENHLWEIFAMALFDLKKKCSLLKFKALQRTNNIHFWISFELSNNCWSCLDRSLDIKTFILRLFLKYTGILIFLIFPFPMKLKIRKKWKPFYQPRAEMTDKIFENCSSLLTIYYLNFIHSTTFSKHLKF